MTVRATCPGCSRPTELEAVAAATRIPGDPTPPEVANAPRLRCRQCGWIGSRGLVEELRRRHPLADGPLDSTRGRPLIGRELRGAPRRPSR